MMSLCECCRHKREVISARGSRFLLCRLALEDERFRKYPPQPIRSCPGFEVEPPPTGSAEASEPTRA